MSISDEVRGWLKFGAWVLALIVGGAVVWGQFRGGTEARVSANEKSIVQHETKIDQLCDHASKAEADMVWIKGAVTEYDRKQQVVLDEIRTLKP